MEYKIPLFDLNFDINEEKAVLDVLSSRWISTGPRNIEFEKNFSSMLGVKYCVALTNCTAALHLALRILGIKEGDEVIIPSLTFVATANAVRYVGATPVFCDIKDCDDLTLDPGDMEELINDRTMAIMVMHYGGFPCDMDGITEIADCHGLKIIEDASHSPLSEYRGRKLGTLGDIGCFSFFTNKNISTGEGGMLVTNSEEYFNKAKLYRSHGMTTLSYERARGHSTSYDVIEHGYNYRMDDIRAAIGIEQLKKLPGDLEKRASIREHYIERLSDIDNIVIPFKGNDNFVSNYIFPIVLKNSSFEKRESTRRELHEKGIQTSVHYPAVHRFSIFERFARELKNTDYVTDNEITLPIYSGLTTGDVDFIADSISEILG